MKLLAVVLLVAFLWMLMLATNAFGASLGMVTTDGNATNSSIYTAYIRK